MRIVAPSALLAPSVRELMIVEVGDEVTRLRLPEPGLVLGVRFRGSASLVTGDGSARLPDATLTGVSNTASRMRTTAGGGIVLARFHPGGAAQFFAEPLHELFGGTLSLDAIVPRSEVERARDRAAEASTDAERAAALEALLIARMGRGRPDPVVAAAVRAIVASHGGVRVDALARSLAISQDPLEKRFRRAVGASPKQLASLLRLRYAIDAYRPGVRLTELAVRAGYFDQSHFSRELRAMTGQAPGRFFGSGDVL